MLGIGVAHTLAGWCFVWQIEYVGVSGGYWANTVGGWCGKYSRGYSVCYGEYVRGDGRASITHNSSSMTHNS